MKKTFVQAPNINIVEYNSPVCFIGSCFSESISKKAEIHCFNVESNPLGVVFNPISLGDFLLHLNNDSWNFNIVKRKDLYFSWEANSSVFDYSEQEIYAKIQKTRSSFERTLSKSKTLFVTFGTAWIYELLENDHIVANCHKFDQRLFNKRLVTIGEIVNQWNQVIEFLNSEYPELNIVFTLSPVRHIKDGLIDNARNKAVLLESIHQLVDSFKNCHYFPAYEIVLDELRDYGYYSKDGLHPNELAIEEVWAKFFESMLSEKAKNIALECGEIRKLFDHKIQYEKSEEAQKFLKFRAKQLALFKSKYPEIKLDF
jgi:hypothetical protein